MKHEDLKTMVRDKYSQIAEQTKAENESSCCGAGGCGTVDYAVFNEDYSQLDGYAPDADLGLGCGLPTQFARIKTGQTVVDLGSGAGNDCFVARQLTGPEGKIIGLDMTPAMIEKARINADKMGFNNVEFRQGDIEDMPIGGDRADVVVSNCVLNLVPDKQQAFAEIYRILKKGGHFSISDVVLEGELPAGLQASAEMYAGCVAGAIQKEDYLEIIRQQGFTNLRIDKERLIQIPDDILAEYLDKDQLALYHSGDFGILSINVYAEKPTEPCCAPGCC